MRLLHVFVIMSLIYAYWIPLHGQIVNTEKMRSVGKGQGWSGEVDLSLGLRRNRAGQSLRLGTQFRLDHQRGKHASFLFASLNRLTFRASDPADPAKLLQTGTNTFTNNRFIHLRYNYRGTEKIHWEAFSQVQNNSIQKVKLRYLAGTGPRFVVPLPDSSNAFIGILYMYEYEESFERDVVPESEYLAHRKSHRISTYLSFRTHLNPYIVLGHISYYQPRIDAWEDYRISSESQLSIKVNEKLSLRAVFQIVFDSRPPSTVNKNMYALTNGISLSF